MDHTALRVTPRAATGGINGRVELGAENPRAQLMTVNRVLAISASPAVDQVAIAPGARAGGTVRVRETLDTAGGKAIHVSIVAGLLGVASHVLVPVGGATGERLIALASVEPLILHPVAISGETRVTTTVVDPGHGDILELLNDSPVLTDDEVAALLACITKHADSRTLAVISGSAPPGRPGLPAELSIMARGAGAMIIADTSGPALGAVIAAGAADLITPNLREACELLGRRVPRAPSPEDLASTATAVAAAGAPNVLLSAGEQGAVLVAEGAAWHIRLPTRIERVNAVGCGDALVGGLAAGLVRSMTLRDAARLGVAAASSKLTKLHPARVLPDEVDSLFSEIVVAEVVCPA